MLALPLAGALATPSLAQTTPDREGELAELRAQVRMLAQRIEQLEGEMAETRTDAIAPPALPPSAIVPAASAPKTEFAWRGAPQISHDSGWSFKPRGRLMYDAGLTSVPEGTGRDDGFGNEARRARLGVEGDIPGRFGYKFEVDFANNEVEVADAILTYAPGPVEIAVGQHNNFQSLEELTSSLHTSFIERAAFTDAFGFQRRLGISATYGSGIVLAQAGVFTDNWDETASDNRGADARIVLMPRFGSAQAHFAGSVHYNDFGTAGTNVRYRQRPLVHFTSERFIDTGNIGASSEFGYGLEGALISGPFHVAAEGYWQRIDRAGGLAEPTYFGGYLEAGYFLTSGDTRGYKAGKFDRVKPNSPFGEGGIGSIQVNLRYDHLDLTDAGLIGGQQDGYYASLIWKPIDYAALMLNYGRLQYEDAVYAVAPGDRSYGVDAFAVRAQIDF